MIKAYHVWFIFGLSELSGLLPLVEAYKQVVKALYDESKGCNVLIFADDRVFGLDVWSQSVGKGF